MSKHEIMMPVIAMCDKCIDCPELDIEIAKKEINVPILPFQDDDFSMERIIENTIYCKHYERCKYLCSAIFDEDEESNAKKKKDAEPVINTKKDSKSNSQ